MCTLRRSAWQGQAEGTGLPTGLTHHPNLVVSRLVSRARPSKVWSAVLSRFSLGLALWVGRYSYRNHRPAAMSPWYPRTWAMIDAGSQHHGPSFPDAAGFVDVDVDVDVDGSGHARHLPARVNERESLRFNFDVSQLLSISWMDGISWFLFERIPY